MHPYLIWNIGPPLRCSIVIGCPCLYTKAFFVLPMHWLIHVPAIHSVVNVVPIPGRLRQLLLALFIKLDPAPKCGIAWFIMKDFLSSFFWELSSDWLRASCQHPSRLLTSLKLPPVEKSFKYMWSPAFMELSSHPDMNLMLCSKQTHHCKRDVFLYGFLLAYQIRSWK